MARSRWSLSSHDSFLSFESKGSDVSVGSLLSMGSMLSSASRWLVMSHRSVDGWMAAGGSSS